MFSQPLRVYIRTLISFAFDNNYRKASFVLQENFLVHDEFRGILETLTDLPFVCRLQADELIKKGSNLVTFQPEI